MEISYALLCVFMVGIFINGYAFEGCPEGKEVGDQWSVKENCTLCTCEEKNVTCIGCSASPQILRISKDCYPARHHPDADYYPRCCPSLVPVCKGNAGFNEDHFKYFNSLTHRRK